MQPPDSNSIGLEVKDARTFPFVMVDRNLIQSPSLTPNEKVTYALLCSYANVQDGTCYPSINTLSENLGIARNTVKKALRGLEAHGVIKVSQRQASHPGFVSHLYTLVDWRHDVKEPRSINDHGQPMTKPRSKRDQTLGQQLTPNYNHIELDPINENQEIAAIAKPQSPPTAKPKRISKEPDPRIRQVIDGTEATYGAKYLQWPKQVAIIAKLVGLYEVESIVGCWAAISRERDGEFVPFAWVADRIESYKRMGRLAQKGPRNHGYTGGSTAANPDITDDHRFDSARELIAERRRSGL